MFGKLRLRLGSRKQKQKSRDSCKQQRRLLLEPLERRLLLATFAVTNTLDSGGGSLRQAIADANTNAGADTIDRAA